MGTAKRKAGGAGGYLEHREQEKQEHREEGQPAAGGSRPGWRVPEQLEDTGAQSCGTGRDTCTLCQGRLRLGIGKICSLKGLSSPGAGGVPISRGIYVKKTRRCGTWGHGLVVALAVLGE